MKSKEQIERENLVAKIESDATEAVSKVIEDVEVAKREGKIDKALLDIKICDKEKLVLDKNIIIK